MVYVRKKIVPEVGFVISIFVTGMMMIAKTMLYRRKRGSQNICGSNLASKLVDTQGHRLEPRSSHRDSHLKLTTSKLLQLELWLWLLWFAISERRMGLIHA